MLKFLWCKYIFFVVSIGFLIAFYRVWFKFIKVQPYEALFWLWIFTALIGGIIIFFLKWELFSIFTDKLSLIWVLISSFSLVSSSCLIIIAFQRWFRVSIFSPAYVAFSIVVIVLIWKLIFKEKISFQNIIGLILVIIAIFLLR